MNIKNGNSFLRIQLLTPANFGAAGGKATLDSPTQVDVYTGLPYIPDSSLKGVFKSIFETNKHGDIEIVFGSQDVNSDTVIEFDGKNSMKSQYSSGKLIFGNGELLAFPFVISGGQRLWIFPMDNLIKFVELENLAATNHQMGSLFHGFYTSHDHILIFGDPAKVKSLDFKFSSFNVINYPNELKQFHTCLKRWCANAIPQDEPWLIVKADTALELWLRSAEYRTLTALNELKTALGQSLRRIELVPANTLFLSFLTWLEDKPFKLEMDAIQVGAYESLGLGFCNLSAVEDTLLIQDNQKTESIALERTDVFSGHEIMVDCHRRIAEIAKDDNLGAKVRSIITSFGARVQREGIEVALGFEFAKAKIAIKPEGKEAIAHRWFISNLLEKKESELPNCWETWFANQINSKDKEKLLLRWQWFRRYSEILIKKEE
ncbi:hypothetical protein GX408_03415 [bacterium]|nr:hypothetical protein [bacterium]